MIEREGGMTSVRSVVFLSDGRIQGTHSQPGKELVGFFSR